MPEAKTITNEQLYDILTKEYNQPFSGWDFSYLSRRMVSESPPWSYKIKVMHAMKNIRSLLDIGTGGGEFLSSLKALPKHTSATEGYKPNITIATRRLKPLGVKVYEVEGHQLPFKNGQFELVINRHESYSSQEVFRVLKENGRFLTQQVGWKNDLDLLRLLGAKRYIPVRKWDLEHAMKGLRRVGFDVLERMEAFISTRFSDVGAITYYLKAVPWVIPDFSIKKYFDALVKIHEKIQSTGHLKVTNHRFFLVARRSLPRDRGWCIPAGEFSHLEESTRRL